MEEKGVAYELKIEDYSSTYKRLQLLDKLLDINIETLKVAKLPIIHSSEMNQYRWPQAAHKILHLADLNGIRPRGFEVRLLSRNFNLTEYD